MYNDRQQSEFNMAISYLNRLNQLFYTADESAINLNAHQWFHTLLALYRELITEATPSEVEELNSKMIKINPLLEANQKAISKTGIPSINTLLYLELHTFEITLRNIMKNSGLLLKMKEDPGMALK